MKNEFHVYVETFYRELRGSLNAFQIVYATAEDKVVNIHYNDAGKLKVGMFNKESLKQIDERHEGGFLFANRNCLVNKKEIISLFPYAPDKFRLLLRGVAAPVEVSRRNVKKIREFLESRP